MGRKENELPPEELSPTVKLVIPQDMEENRDDKLPEELAPALAATIDTNTGAIGLGALTNQLARAVLQNEACWKYREQQHEKANIIFMICKACLDDMLASKQAIRKIHCTTRLQAYNEKDLPAQFIAAMLDLGIDVKYDYLESQGLVDYCLHWFNRRIEEYVPDLEGLSLKDLKAKSSGSRRNFFY